MTHLERAYLTPADNRTKTMKFYTIKPINLVLATVFCASMAAPAVGQGHTNPTDRISNPSALEFTDTEIAPQNLNKYFVRDGFVSKAERFARVVPSMSEDQVRSILGEPVRLTGKHDREWDYNFKFIMPHSANYRICQYKVTFDKNRQVVGAVWRRRQCEELASVR